MKWSTYQENIFNFVEHGTGNAIVEAVAGSGKTTTMVEALRRIEFVCPDTVLLAFNKSIAEELKSRGVNGKTFHALCWGPVTKYLGIKQVDANKTRKIMSNILNFSEIKVYGSFITRLVSLVKQFGLGVLIEDTRDQWNAIVEHHDLNLESERGDINRAIDFAREVFETGNLDTTSCDFDDLLYFAVKDDIKLPKFDFVFVDEAQDTNAIQRELIRKIMKPDSRLVAVGDPAQAIYGFRGSDSNSLNMIKEEFNCQKLPLTVSYRCPKAVIEYAQQWVGHIEACDGAPEGEVIELKTWYVDDILPGDLVVCRTVKPIIALAYKMLTKKRVAPYVLGRDIGISMQALIRKMNAANVDGLISRLEQWKTSEIAHASETFQESKIQAIVDKFEALMCLINGMKEGEERTIEKLTGTIESLFTNKANSAMLCTIHKAKGLENERVFWLNSKMMPPKWATLDWQKEQELNLCYVAATRAKETLVLIEEQ